ncbi:hypothetical protein GOV12_04975 [Candidatus Pacearchaeota archaeon]|nr:hypothetical protein [Candidatus Pacearchaeota archaeon]
MGFIRYIKKDTGKKLVFFVLILFIISWSVFLYIYSPQRLVDEIGNENALIFSFIAALVGGTSILFPFPYYLFVFSFGAGGVNPFLLGIFAGLGLIIGDTTSYLIAYRGKDVLPKKLSKIFDKLCSFCLNKKYKWYVPVFLYFYGAIFPLPNDLIVVPLGLAKYPYWKMMIPLGLGLITFNTLLALAGLYGLGWFI